MDHIGGGISNVAGKIVESYIYPYKKIIRTIDKKLLRKRKPSSTKNLKRNDQESNIKYNYNEYQYEEYFYDDYDEHV